MEWSNTWAGFWAPIVVIACASVLLATVVSAAVRFRARWKMQLAHEAGLAAVARAEEERSIYCPTKLRLTISEPTLLGIQTFDEPFRWTLWDDSPNQPDSLVDGVFVPLAMGAAPTSGMARQRGLAAALQIPWVEDLDVVANDVVLTVIPEGG